MPVTVKATVVIDFSGLKQFREQIDAQLNNQAEGPITKAFRQWGARYRAFIRERFDKFSKGGGDWAPLAESTKNQRRSGIKKPTVPRRSKYKTSKAFMNAKKRYTKKKEAFKKKRRFTILRDTGTLFAALSPTFNNAPGAIEKKVPFGIIVGYGGSHNHPKGKATIADIASFHQTGNSRLPKREIIVQPSQKVIGDMIGDMDRAINTIIKSRQ